MSSQKDSKHVFQQKLWVGISNLLKEPSSQDPYQPINYYYSENINVRTDPYAPTLNFATVKESGGTVTDFVKWADITPASLTTYFYGDTGNIYSRNINGAYSYLHQAPNSHGNGLQYFYGDDYLYYPNDSTLGRYGPIAYAPTILENWNTNTINNTIWNDYSHGNASAVTGQLVFTHSAATVQYDNVLSIQSHNAIGKRFFTQIVSAGNQSLASWEVIFGLVSVGSDQVYISINGGTVIGYKKINGVSTSIGSIAYNTSVHKYIGIAEINGMTYFQVSTDGVSWTTVASVANPIALNSVTIGLETGTYSSEASGTSAIFDNFGVMTSGNTIQFSDDFLAAQGGVPQNTYSLGLVAASSQYASAADSATLDVTGNLTLDAYVYLNSLPTVGNSMVIVGKWDESGALRSYIMDIYGVSGYFGDGSDGSLTISVDTTESPIDAACLGTLGSYTLFATNVSFALNQQILIHQTQGTNAGQFERNVISGYSAGTMILQTPLLGTYTAGAQVRVLKQYTTVTVNAGITYKPKAWNGTVGGILAFLANGTMTVAIGGVINADGRGFRGAATSALVGAYTGTQGEGTVGSTTTTTTSNNGSGGGGGGNGTFLGGGGGGGNAVQGDGMQNVSAYDGTGGIASGSSDLTTMTFGGGGGSGGYVNNNFGGGGGTGGGIIYITAPTITVTGSITSIGSDGLAAANNGGAGGGGGAGAGGSILLNAQTATLGTNQVIANGGSGGAGVNGGITGASSSAGRIALNYLTSYTGSTTLPSINILQDNTLVTTTTYQMRLGISNDGTANEYLTKNLASLTTGQWNRLSISWTAASSLGTFYLNGNSLGTVTGTKTSISSNVSLLYVGAKKGASAVGSFLDGYIDDVRVWGNVQSDSNIILYLNKQLTGSEGGLKAYYELNNAATDLSGNTNTLTLHGTPSYSINVPFVDPTTRLDIDQSFTTIGFDYDLLTSISELAVDSLSFTPANDPQKSVDINMGTKGTGDVTVTVHDQTNTIIAQKTITNANLASAGYQEFVWTTPWRIVIGKTYHLHVTSTVNDGTVISSVDDDLSKGNFHTYFQFLVTDSLFHPVSRWLNFLVIGNERYLAKWDGAFYTANLIAFPQGTHVRCFGYWGIYLAIGVWQEAGTGTPNVYDFSTGKIYFWDGISLTYNFAIDVPEGQVNAIFGMDSDLYYVAGWKGDLLYYQGSWANQSGSFNGSKIKRIPYLEPTSYLEVYPQAMANYQGLLHMGLAANTDSTSFPKGIYSWGAIYPDYPKSLTFDHLISTGNKGSSVKIGMIYPVGQKLLASWKDGISYGVDVVDPTAGVYHTSGLLQTNLLDGGQIWKNDLYLKVRADHIELQTGEGIVTGFKLDRETNFEVTGSITDTLNKITTNTISNGRATEGQLQVQLTGDGSSTPTLLALSAQIDSLDQELAF